MTGRGSPPIFVCGVPRSGTTWLARVLARAPGCRYVHEPDNHHHRPFALRAKRGLGPFPAMDLDGRHRSDRFTLLWEAAFAGAEGRGGRLEARLRRRLMASPSALKDGLVGAQDAHGYALLRPTLSLVQRLARPPRPRRSTTSGRVVVKSVQAMLSLEWITGRWHPITVLIQREPLNVVASWLALGWDDLGPIPREVEEHLCRRWGIDPLPEPRSLVERVAWRVGFLASAVLDAGKRLAARDEGGIVFVRHADLCARPFETFRALFERLDLEWNEEVEAFVRDSNRPGFGYDTHRVWSEQPTRWRSLEPSVRRRVEVVLARFPALTGDETANVPQAQW
ncbi:hypothetical protein HRbin41_00302 [bacterium HR41]|nr:hypothetical protein HRbin41_00302 [bacterium HR41]